MGPDKLPQLFRCRPHPPAVAGLAEWQADPGIRRRWARRAATLLDGAVRDRSRPAAPRAPPGFPREPHGIALRFAGTAQGSSLETAPLPDHTDSTGLTPPITKPWQNPS